MVDDDPTILSLFEAVLSEDNWLCTSVPTAEDALELAEAERFDLAVFDLHLPGMSGAEAAWKIRTKHGDVPIIAMSGHLDLWDTDDLTDLGVDRILAKPFSPDQLRVAMSEAMEARRGRSASAD